MQKPKKLFNNTDNIRSEIMEGLVYAGRGRIHAPPGVLRGLSHDDANRPDRYRQRRRQRP